eukprot:746391-Hanusia_phi.AAC.1
MKFAANFLSPRAVKLTGSEPPTVTESHAGPARPVAGPVTPGTVNPGRHAVTGGPAGRPAPGAVSVAHGGPVGTVRA